MGTEGYAGRELVVVGRRYWNIKKCGHSARDLTGKSSEVSLLRCGGFCVNAPQMRHTKKGRMNHEKTQN